jgi:pimeloyl-ACP methyl ester carboxylesterase
MDYNNDFEDLNVGTSLGSIHLKHHSGSKQKLLFLHGFGINSRAWGKLMNVMPDDLDIYLMDLLGHGSSDAPMIEYTVDKQTQALKEVVERLMLQECYIIAHSYSGWAALLYAIEGRPAKGFVLEDVAGVEDHVNRISNPDVWKEFNDFMFRSAMKYAGNKEYVMRSILDTQLKNRVLAPDDLAKIDRPTLIIWGSDDRMIQPASAYTLRDSIKGSLLEVVQGAGHEPHYTKPDVVKTALLKFIAYV